MARKNSSIKSVTLLELIIAIALLSVIVLGLTSIDFFSRHHVVDADRRAKLQNQLYFVLEHMNRTITGTTNVGGAIGNEYLNTDTAPYPSVVDINHATGNTERTRLKIYVDAGNGTAGSSPDGIRQADVGNNPNTYDDHWVVYLFYDASGPMPQRQEIQYCDRCKSDKCQNCMGNNWVTLADNIVKFDPVKPVDGTGNLNDNHIDVEISACFDPWYADASRRITSYPCGSGDNPEVTMKTSIKMPSVTVN